MCDTWNWQYLKNYVTELSENLTSGLIGPAWILVNISLKVVKNVLLIYIWLYDFVSHPVAGSMIIFFALILGQHMHFQNSRTKLFGQIIHLRPEQMWNFTKYLFIVLGNILLLRSPYLWNEIFRQRRSCEEYNRKEKHWKLHIQTYFWDKKN